MLHLREPAFGRRLPEFLEPFSWLFDWSVLAAVGIVSLVAFVASLLAIPYVVSRLPADFLHKQAHGICAPGGNSPGRLALRVLRNVVGLVLLLLGIVMLVLPGQGILSIVVSLVLLDFPGKRRLLRRFLSSPRVLSVGNGIRRRAGKEPFLPVDDDAGAHQC
jgi:hypothetical protein